jgi:hypothetical protein
MSLSWQTPSRTYCPWVSNQDSMLDPKQDVLSLGIQSRPSSQLCASVGRFPLVPPNQLRVFTEMTSKGRIVLSVNLLLHGIFCQDFRDPKQDVLSLGIHSMLDPKQDVLSLGIQCMLQETMTYLHLQRQDRAHTGSPEPLFCCVSATG